MSLSITTLTIVKSIALRYILFIEVLFNALHFVRYQFYNTVCKYHYIHDVFISYVVI